jgi:hypothetical protein
METKIKVGVRVRPLIQREQDGSSDQSVIVAGNRINIRQPNQREGQAFTFDWAFDHNDSQMNIYENMATPLIKNLFKGFNATILVCHFYFLFCILCK